MTETFTNDVASMGVSSRGGWIFIHGTDIVGRLNSASFGLFLLFFDLFPLLPPERGLIVLFFVFSVFVFFSLENFLPTPLVTSNEKLHRSDDQVPRSHQMRGLKIYS